jgi:hypothetical protein
MSAASCFMTIADRWLSLWMGLPEVVAPIHRDVAAPTVDD